MQCKICSKDFNSIESLRKHYGRVHKIPSQKFYNEFVLSGNVPTCKCGCGEIPRFISFEKGYKEWIRGHISRVENNWGHSQTAIQNSANTRRKQYKSGEREVWNKGLSKKESKSLETAGKKISELFDDDRKKTYSKRMRKMRLDGTIETKYGKHSANWKGGTSSINNLVRANKRLYEEWIYPILKKQNFTCQTCGSTDNLEVHHNSETMSEILHKFVDKNGEYTFEEKRKIMNDVIDYHITEEVSGKVLCKECHKNLHPSYNT
jgi:hypothetical protein